MADAKDVKVDIAAEKPAADEEIARVPEAQVEITGNCWQKFVIRQQLKVKNFKKFVDTTDWNHVGHVTLALFIYWGVSIGYFMIFYGWLLADYKSQRVFNLVFFFVSVVVVLVAVLSKQYLRALESDPSANVNENAGTVANQPPPVGSKDWQTGRSASFVAAPGNAASTVGAASEVATGTLMPEKKDVQ